MYHARYHGVGLTVAAIAISSLISRVVPTQASPCSSSTLLPNTEMDGVGALSINITDSPLACCDLCAANDKCTCKLRAGSKRLSATPMRVP